MTNGLQEVTLSLRDPVPVELARLEMRGRVWLWLVDAARRVVSEEALRNALRIRIESRRPG